MVVNMLSSVKQHLEAMPGGEELDGPRRRRRAVSWPPLKHHLEVMPGEEVLHDGPRHRRRAVSSPPVKQRLGAMAGEGKLHDGPGRKRRAVSSPPVKQQLEIKGDEELHEDDGPQRKRRAVVFSAPVVTLSTLPDDELLVVLRFLTTRELLQARALCRRWRDLIRHPDLWNRVSVKIDALCSQEDVAVAMGVLRVAPCLKELIIGTAYAKHVTDHRRLALLPATTACAAARLKISAVHDDEEAALAMWIIRNQVSLGRLKKLDLFVMGDGFKTLARPLIEMTVSTEGLVDVKVFAMCKFGTEKPALPRVYATPSLQKLTYQRSGLDDADPYLEFLLKSHLATLEVVDLRYSTPKQAMTLLELAPNLREVYCFAVADLPLLAKCRSLDKLHLLVPSTSDSAEEKLLREAAAAFLREATQLKRVAVIYVHKRWPRAEARNPARRNPVARPVAQEDLMSALLSSNGRALEELTVAFVKSPYPKSVDSGVDAAPFLEPLALRQDPHLLHQFPRLTKLVVRGTVPSRWIGGLVEGSMPSLTCLRLELKEECFHDWAHRLDVLLLFDSRPHLHVVFDDVKACGDCNACAESCHSLPPELDAGLRRNIGVFQHDVTTTCSVHDETKNVLWLKI